MKLILRSLTKFGLELAGFHTVPASLDDVCLVLATFLKGSILERGLNKLLLTALYAILFSLISALQAQCGSLDRVRIHGQLLCDFLCAIKKALVCLFLPQYVSAYRLLNQLL